MSKNTQTGNLLHIAYREPKSFHQDTNVVSVYSALKSDPQICLYLRTASFLNSSLYLYTIAVLLDDEQSTCLVRTFDGGKPKRKKGTSAFEYIFDRMYRENESEHQLNILTTSNPVSRKTQETPASERSEYRTQYNRPFILQ